MTSFEESGSTVANARSIDSTSEPILWTSDCSTFNNNNQVYHRSEGSPPMLVIESQASSANNTPNIGPSFPPTTENLLKFNKVAEGEHKKDEECKSLMEQQTRTLTEHLKGLGVDIPNDYIKRMRPVAVNSMPMKRFLSETDSNTKQVKMYERNVNGDLGHISHMNENPVDEEEDQLSLSPMEPVNVDKESTLILYLQNQTSLRDLHRG